MNIIKTIIINLICGLIIAIVSYLIFSNIFTFGLFYFFILMILFYYVTTPLNWVFTILNFVASFFLTVLILHFMKKYPSLQLLDDESFPTVSYFIYSLIVWVINKILIDIFFKMTLPERFIKSSIVEDYYKKQSPII